MWAYQLGRNSVGEVWFSSAQHLYAILCVDHVYGMGQRLVF